MYTQKPPEPGVGKDLPEKLTQELTFQVCCGQRPSCIWSLYNSWAGYPSVGQLRSGEGWQLSQVTLTFTGQEVEG